jgi:hypothetical protein
MVFICPQKTIPNIAISEGGTNSSHMHNLAKSQSYQGLKLLLRDIKFMSIVNSMLIYHRCQDN